MLAELGIAPPAAAGAPLGPDDQRFSPIAIGHRTHRLVEVKLLLDQLGIEQKELLEPGGGFLGAAVSEGVRSTDF